MLYQNNIVIWLLLKTKECRCQLYLFFLKSRQKSNIDILSTLLFFARGYNEFDNE